MIRKFFIVGKQLYLQSKNMENYEELGHVIELSMPIEVFWEMERLLKDANYIRSSGGSQAEVFENYKQIFGCCAPYAILEKERKWLYERSRESK